MPFATATTIGLLVGAGVAGAAAAAKRKADAAKKAQDAALLTPAPAVLSATPAPPSAALAASEAALAGRDATTRIRKRVSVVGRVSTPRPTGAQRFISGYARPRALSGR
jgi:hypothetical protein